MEGQLYFGGDGDSANNGIIGAVHVSQSLTSFHVCSHKTNGASEQNTGSTQRTCNCAPPVGRAVGCHRQFHSSKLAPVVESCSDKAIGFCARLNGTSVLRKIPARKLDTQVFGSVTGRRGDFSVTLIASGTGSDVHRRLSKFSYH